MIARELVGTASVPGHRGELRCYRHDRDFAIWIDRTELMSSRVHGSEEALAELGLAHLGDRAQSRVLIGGLGMGFTLARALALVPDDATIDVAEIVPAVVEWNRELFGHCAGHPLRDPRAHVFVGDVADAIAAAKAEYDAILLDVDNGPEGLSRPANDRLYDPRGLAAIHTALRPGAVLAVWSSADHHAFEARLRRAPFRVETHHVRARRSKGPRRTIWVAARR
ncbi:MAG: hypothetical protein JNK78_07345 [Planctomycetes bacterium]|nr:hypothetical protein [Planctomycetota bacterium]